MVLFEKSRCVHLLLHREAQRILPLGEFQLLPEGLHPAAQYPEKNTFPPLNSDHTNFGVVGPREQGAIFLHKNCGARPELRDQHSENPQKFPLQKNTPIRCPQ